MLRFLLPLAIIVAVAYIGIAIYLYYSQAGFVYFPKPEIVSTPEEEGMDYQDVMLRTEDGLTLQAWFVPATTSHGTILFCHGNGGNLSYVVSTIGILHRLGFDVLAFDYRGYGRSEGTPDEEGTYRDAEAAWKYLTEERGIEADHIVLHGRSLGGGVASWLATRHTPRALILESTFISIPDMGARIFPMFPIRVMATINYNTSARMKDIHCPVLVIHSRDDEMIPFGHGQDLFRLANEPKEFVEIGGNHNGGYTSSGDAYIGAINMFLQRHVSIHQ